MIVTTDDLKLVGHVLIMMMCLLLTGATVFGFAILTTYHSLYWLTWEIPVALVLTRVFRGLFNWSRDRALGGPDVPKFDPSKPIFLPPPPGLD